MANEDKATRYQRLRRRASVAGNLSAGLVIGLAAALGPPDWAMAAGSAGPLARLTALTPGALSLVALCLAARFPAVFFRDVVLTRRYGLLRGRPVDWISDWGRHVLVHTAIGTAGIVACAALRWATVDWWWAIAGLCAGIAPLVAGRLVRVSGKTAGTPLARGRLRDRLTGLLEKAGYADLGLFQVHVSERTRAANAAVVTEGGARRVVVSDTLLADHTDEEVEVVVAHELAHVAHHDVVLAQAALAVHTALSLLVVEGALRWLGAPEDVPHAATLPAGLAVSALAFVLLRPLSLGLSRFQERRADRYALTLTGNGPALSSVVRRLAANNLAEPAPSAATVWWFHSHPPASQRMQAAERAGMLLG